MRSYCSRFVRIPGDTLSSDVNACLICVSQVYPYLTIASKTVHVIASMSKMRIDKVDTGHSAFVIRLLHLVICLRSTHTSKPVCISNV